MSLSLRLLVLPLLAISSATLAQSNFQPGYVLPVAGDTLRGEVDSRGAQALAKSSRFRAGASAPVVEYQPEQLRGYGFASGSHYQAQALPGAAAAKVFMNTLVLGPLALYGYTDGEGKAHYYSRKGPAALLELVQRDTSITRGSAQTGQLVTTKERLYPLRSVLWSQMADCPTAQVTVKNLELKESQLIKAVTAYNACVGGPVQYAQKPRASKVRLSVVALATRAQVDVQEIKGEDIRSDFRPGGGIGLDFAPAFLNPKLSLHLQLLYVQQQFTKQYQVPESALVNGTDGQINYRIALNSIQLPATLRYTYPKGALRPYIQAGPMLSVHTKKQADASLTYKRYTGVSETNSYSIEVRNFNLGAVVGLGLLVPTQRGDFTLEARGERTDGISEGAGRISGKRGIAVVAGFTFGK